LPLAAAFWLWLFSCAWCAPADAPADAPAEVKPTTAAHDAVVLDAPGDRGSISPRSSARLTPLDWAVVLAYGLAMLSVGWYYSRKTQTTDDYLLGGRRMKPFGVGLSLFATLISTISYLSVPGEIVGHGPVNFATLVGFPFAFIIVGWLVIPTVMQLKVTSGYEILESRLGSSVRMAGSLLFLSLRLLWMALIVYTTTEKALIPFMGLDPQYAPLVSLVLCVATIAYTSMGGLRAVVVTDAVQSFILLGAAIASVMYVSYQLGGIANWWPRTYPEHWQQPKFWFDPTVRLTVTGVFLNGFLWYLCTNTSDQMALQRFLATRDASAARGVLAVALIADATVLCVLGLLGVALLAFYNLHQDWLPPGKSILEHADQLYPDFIVMALPQGITGFVVAGLLSAAMSSLSSGMNAVTSVIMADILGQRSSDEHAPREAGRVVWAKLITVSVGAVVILLSLYVGRVPGNLIDLANKISGLLTAPLFLLFFMALWVPWATPTGTLVGAAASIVVSVAVSIYEVYGLSFVWILPLSLAVGIPTAMLVSLLPIGRRHNPA